MVRPIGVLAAIPQEQAALARIMTGVSTADGFTVGSIDDTPLCVGLTGIGKVNAAVTATQLCERFDPGVIVFTGVAGGLDPELEIGDVVIGISIIQHDAGVLGDDGLDTYQAGHIPFFNPTDTLGYRPSDRLVAAVRRELGPPPFSLGNGGRIVLGTILTGDQFLASDRQRELLHSRFTAQAIEMEGGAVAQVADRYGIDQLAIRTLSDLAGSESSETFTEFLDLVAHQTVEVFRRLLPTFAAASSNRD